MAGLLGPNGQPMSTYLNKKEPPPKLGEAFAPWAGRDMEFMSMPGGGLVQFDLSKLTLDDYRNMRDHYQVNSSLAVLSFMQHQSDWHIDCEDKKIADGAEQQLRNIWTSLNRSLSTANWAGYSPNAMDWENNIQERQVEITKIKDLVPEECTVHWKEIEGWAPPDRHVRPKYKIYDGINYAAQRGWHIPVENSFWYPLLMENGDYYGKKLLRPAFQSWFFSILIHLFANRYFERFGEPVPIGRAPFEEEIDIGGQKVRGNEYMLEMIQSLRNRSVVVLPNERTQLSDSQFAYDYELQYLESQMRGADFERYLTRLDEEISLGLFTPILLLRTADVGSYNLGVGHMQMYLWMLNAMNDDRAQYINKYILRKWTNYNFSVNAPSPKIKFRKMGNSDVDMIKQLLVALVNGGKVGVDLEELGQIAGLTLKQVKQTTAPAPAPTPAEEELKPEEEKPAEEKKEEDKLPEARFVLAEIKNRVASQVGKAFREHQFNSDTKLMMGFKRRFEKNLEIDGVMSAKALADEFYGRMDYWLEDIVSLGESEFSGADSFMAMFDRVLDSEFDRIKSQV